MQPLPRLTPEAPGRWLPAVALNPEDVALVLQHLPTASPAYEQLMAAMDQARRHADRLNRLADRQSPPAVYRRFE